MKKLMTTVVLTLVASSAIAQTSDQMKACIVQNTKWQSQEMIGNYSPKGAERASTTFDKLQQLMSEYDFSMGQAMECMNRASDIAKSPNNRT
ncbi:hypothetical protein AB8I23_004177 [Vibrio alginolyticus]|nr:hypothetical protein [Vibrio parahaemolyticus]EJC7127672.1 hypothetical protein [Vibrio parahaemolyticus]